MAFKQKEPENKNPDTKRLELAGQIFSALITAQTAFHPKGEMIAELAVDYADLLLAALAKKKE